MAPLDRAVRAEDRGKHGVVDDNARGPARGAPASLAATSPRARAECL